MTCPSCHGPNCTYGHCTSTRVQVRQVLIRHLSHTPLLNRAFGDRLDDLMHDLAPHLAPEPPR